MEYLLQIFFNFKFISPLRNGDFLHRTLIFNMSNVNITLVYQITDMLSNFVIFVSILIKNIFIKSQVVSYFYCLFVFLFLSFVPLLISLST